MRRYSILLTILVMLLALTPALVPAAQAKPSAEVPWPTSGWQTTSPEAQGVDSGQLTAFLDGFNSFPHSVLVIRHGAMILNASSAPFSASRVHAAFGIAHSVISTLVGIAIDKGHIKGIDQSIWDFLPKDKTANMDANKAAITIGNLLTYRAGIGPFRFTDDDAALYGLTDKDPPAVQVYLDTPMQAKPGTVVNYVDADPLVLSAILQKATGMTALDYAKQNLLGPLGITDVMWTANPQGITYGGGELYLSPQVMAKLGYLYLHAGQWEGKQVVSSTWVKAATSSGFKTDSVPWDGVGYLWLTGTFGSTGYTGFGALGTARAGENLLNRQVILVIPDLDLVVVLTGDYLVDTGGYLASALIPGVKSDSPLPGNPDALAKLQAQVKAFSDPVPKPVSPVPDNRKSVSGQVYKLDDNPLLWKSFRLDFGAQEAVLTLDAEGRQLKLPVGLDDTYRISSAGLPQNPAKPFYRLRGDVPLAAKGNWSARWFSLDIFDLIGRDNWIVRCKFSGDNNTKVTLDVNYLIGIVGSGSLSIAGTAQ